MGVDIGGIVAIVVEALTVWFFWDICIDWLRIIRWSVKNGIIKVEMSTTLIRLLFWLAFFNRRCKLLPSTTTTITINANKSKRQRTDRGKFNLLQLIVIVIIIIENGRFQRFGKKWPIDIVASVKTSLGSCVFFLLKILFTKIYVSKASYYITTNQPSHVWITHVFFNWLSKLNFRLFHKCQVYFKNKNRRVKQRAHCLFRQGWLMASTTSIFTNFFKK